VRRQIDLRPLSFSRRGVLDKNPCAIPAGLLLHGLGGIGGSWQRHANWLTQAGYRVLAPDMRGFGQSSYPGRTASAGWQTTWQNAAAHRRPGSRCRHFAGRAG
jgi:pimeloyl-ACP methyl ester carboxylesterase